MRPVRQNTPRKTPARVRDDREKDSIAVYCRIRSLDRNDEHICVKVKDDKSIMLFPPDSSYASKNAKMCSFTRVFCEGTNQKQLFDQVALPLVKGLLQGSNGLLFTYGVTSSGKTYTMTGLPEDGGLLPRTLDVVFKSIEKYQAEKFVFKTDSFNGFNVQSIAEALIDRQKDSGSNIKTPRLRRRGAISEWSNRVSDNTLTVEVSPDMRYSVFVSYIEIYNNYIYDLLDDWNQESRKKDTKLLREDATQSVYVCKTTESEVKTVDEAIELFNKGQQNRKVSNTALNSESSRSHSVFTIRVVQAPLDSIGEEVLQDREQITVSQLSLVDLAGSERQLRTKNSGHTLKEAGNINNSLMYLRQCIEALRLSKSIHGIPFRQSKITHLFKSYFEGKGKVAMIVCVNPRADDYEENIHVLQFAEATQEVQLTRSTLVSTPNYSAYRGRGEAARRREQGKYIFDFLPPTSKLPEFPSNILEDEERFDELIEFINTYEKRKRTLMDDLELRQLEFRKQLHFIDQENNQLKTKQAMLQKDLDARTDQLVNLEQNFILTEERVISYEEKNRELERQLSELNDQLEEKNSQIERQKQDIQESNWRMQEKLASEKDRLKRIMERRLAEKQLELEGKLCFNGEKFRLLREILNAGDWEYLVDVIPPGPAQPQSSTASSELTVPQTRSKRRSSLSENSNTEVKLPKSRSAIDFIQGSKKSNQASSSQQSSKNDFDYLYAKENKPPSSSQRSIAIANLRHRRSQSSSGDVWVEHKPVGNLELNTVLKPAMKKRKSVSKLKVKDVTGKDVSKYVLEHQECDSQGEMETQLYKGDIIPSAGGGAQVVFSDIEKLRQESPPTGAYNLRKRSSEGLPLREIEDRCTVAVECHGLPSKIMKKK